MAIRTISSTGGFYNAPTAWLEGVVPTSVDDVVSTSTSGPLTVNVFSAAKSIDLSQYANILTMNNGITISGSFSLGNGFTISGTYGVVINSSGSLRSYGKTWSNELVFSGTSTTFTLIDDWVVDSLRYSTTNGSISTTNGKTITASNGLTIATTAQVVGTTKIILTGGTWSHTSTGRISMPIDLNGNVNFGSNIYSGGGTISYVSGTINTTGNTFSIQTGTLGLVNTNSIDFNNFTVTGTSVMNGSDFNLLSNLTISSGLSGTSTIVIKGTSSQTWTSTAYLSNNLTINKSSGTFSVSGIVYYQSGTISYIGGSVSTTNSTLNIGPGLTTINTNGLNWNNFTCNDTATVNLSSNLQINGNIELSKTISKTITITGSQILTSTSSNVHVGYSAIGGVSNNVVVTFPIGTIFNCQNLTIWTSGPLGGGYNTTINNATFNLNGYFDVYFYNQGTSIFNGNSTTVNFVGPSCSIFWYGFNNNYTTIPFNFKSTGNLVKIRVRLIHLDL